MSEIVPVDQFKPWGLPAVGQIDTSLVRTDPAQRLLAHRAVIMRDMTLEDMADTEIEVVHYMSHWVPETKDGKQTGGYRRRIALIDPSGAIIATGSETAWRCIVAAATIAEAKPPFAPPLRFMVHLKPRQGKPGKFIYLEWVL